MNNEILQDYQQVEKLLRSLLTMAERGNDYPLATLSDIQKAIEFALGHKEK